jgi:hypothetical protein
MADIIDDLMEAHRGCPKGGNLPPILVRAYSEILALRRRVEVAESNEREIRQQLRCRIEAAERAGTEAVVLRRERDALLRLTVYEAFGRWIAAAPKGVASHPLNLIGWPTREEAGAALIALGIGLDERAPAMEPIVDEGN